MATPKLQPTRKQLLAELKKIFNSNPEVKITRAYYRAKSNYTSADVERHFGSFGNFVKEAGLEKFVAEKSQEEVQELKGDIWTITLPKTRIHTLPQLIDAFKVDESIWEVERFRCNKWESFYVPRSVGESGAWRRESTEGVIVPLYQVRADFKKKKNIIAIKEEIAELIRLGHETQKQIEPRPVYREQSFGGNVLEINIPDAHFGKFAWSKETNFENYDTKIAAAIYERALDALLFRAKGYTLDEILFVVGNDLLHIDDTELRTTGGTVVTADGRYQKVFRTARGAVIRAIEKCRGYAPVRVIVVPGNHDELSAWHLGESLEFYFSRYDDVTVENEPTPRKAYKYGNVGLMFCHGHKGKKDDYPLQFATEFPEIFGTTKFREVHTGHTHETKTQEFHGVRVRVLPALCPPDDWHSQMGFTGNLRNAEAYLWNKEEGLVAEFFYNDNAQPKIETKTTLVIAQ